MIRNIIFDLGQVLFSFQPKKYLSDKYTLERSTLIMKEIFREKEWKALDRGTITLEDAKKDIISRGVLSKEEVNGVFDGRNSMIVPIKENFNLLESIKENGYNLYILSNFHKDLFYQYFNEIPAFHLFDGKVISSDVNLLKPEREIYNLILKKYQLDPSETLFIDDTLHNIEASGELGIKGLHLKSPSHLKRRLEDLEIL